MLNKILEKTRKIETLLIINYHANGKGLHEKISSVENEINSAEVKKLRWIATMRNKSVHEDGFEIEDLNSFLEECDNVINLLDSHNVNTTNQFIDTDKDDINLTFKNKYKKVFIEIDKIKEKVHKKEGFIFDSHVYSQEELLKSPHHEKIYAITSKIGDDAKYWYLKGQLNETVSNTYHMYRDDVDEKLSSLNTEIMNREPTLWEVIFSILKEFNIWIMENLPELHGWLLATTEKIISRLPVPLKVISSFLITKTNRAFLNSKKIIQENKQD